MNWGLLAYGRIAKKFITSLRTIPEARIVGIASYTNTDAIRKDHPNLTAYNSYDAILENPDIDIVYISTTHNNHHKNVIKALHAGKHVLCEKPLGIHPNEVAEMTRLSKEKNLFLMEAIWTRFLPAYSAMRKHVRQNDLGDIKLVKGDFSFNGTSFDKESRIRNPTLAAGAIWDVGLYPIAMAIDVFDKEPEEIICHGFTDDQNVDTRATIILNFGKDKQAVLHCGIDLETIHDGKIFGSEQWIHLPNFWHGQDLRIGKWDSNQMYHYPIDLSTSFTYEIMACYEAVRNGRIEHPRMTHRHSLIISEIMDEALGQVKSCDV